MIKLYVSEDSDILEDCLFADETKLFSYFEETDCELGYEDCKLFLLEDYVKDKDQQIAELQQKCERLDKERYEESLNLQQFYSRLGVEAYCEDIQEQAIKELEEKDKEFEKYRKDALECYNTSENEIFKLKCEIIQLKTQLHTQPKEIVEKIRKEFEERLKNTVWDGTLVVGKVCNMINDVLDEILKEYEEK